MTRAFRVGVDVKFGAETLEHFLGMVAGRHRLDHRGDARRVEAGEQHGGFDLRGGHGQAVGDGCGIARAAQGDGQSVTRLALDLNAHQAQRIEHPTHRAARQRGITDEGGRHVIDTGKAHGEPRTGSGIAEIERAFRFQQAAIAGALHHPGGIVTRDPGAHGGHGTTGRQHVFAFEQAGDAGFAGRKPAKHQGPVGNRFVARHPDTARQGA